MIGQTISHYRIVEKLGGGGMGVVYIIAVLKRVRLLPVPRIVVAAGLADLRVAIRSWVLSGRG